MVRLRAKREGLLKEREKWREREQRERERENREGERKKNYAMQLPTNHSAHEQSKQPWRGRGPGGERKKS